MAPPVEVEINRLDRIKDRVENIEYSSIQAGSGNEYKQLPPATIVVKCDPGDNVGSFMPIGETKYLKAAMFENGSGPIEVSVETEKKIEFSGNQKIIISDSFHDENIVLSHVPRTPFFRGPPRARPG